MQAKFTEACFALAACIVHAVEADGDRIGELIEQAGAAEEFEVIETLVAGNGIPDGGRNGVGEQWGAGVAGVADAHTGAGEPEKGGRFEGVGEEDGEVEGIAAERGGEPVTGGEVAEAAGGGVDEEAVGEAFA